MMQKIFIRVGGLMMLMFLLVACGGGETEVGGNSEQLQIVTTIGQITDITEIVGGEHVNVNGLMGPGVDPHLYAASASDVNKLQEADIIFYNGLFLEAQMDDILEQLAERKTVVAVSAGADRAKLLASPTYEDEYDPHIWFSVPLWMTAVETVRDTLVAEDATNADDYEANAAKLLGELETLHAYVQAQAERVPAEQRILITAHDAFSYFGVEYGFEVRGLQGISTASEAGTGDVQALANYIVEKQIPAIFVESSVPVRTIEAVQAAVAAQDFEVAIGGELFSDAMGDDGTPEGTYIGMVEHNVDTIVGALLGE
ncbi:MAG TPA: zinc ABC transporter substrate-binding protein [Anaerolineae bacterium]|nr:zinc ABC transporter substrate-binding protein [Anaerolineae bacterium]